MSNFTVRIVDQSHPAFRAEVARAEQEAAQSASSHMDNNGDDNDGFVAAPARGPQLTEEQRAERRANAEAERARLIAEGRPATANFRVHETAAQRDARERRAADHSAFLVRQARRDQREADHQAYLVRQARREQQQAEQEANHAAYLEREARRQASHEAYLEREARRQTRARGEGRR